MKNLLYYLSNQGINYSEIWNDTGLFLCLSIMFSFYALLVAWSAKNYRKQALKEANEASESMLHSISHQLDVFEAENSTLKESIKKYQSERKRDDKGHFIATSGKGHGKKDWNKCTKKDLLKEANRRYRIGGTVLCTYKGDEVKLINKNFEFTSFNEIWGEGEKLNAVLYSNGIWAKKVK